MSIFRKKSELGLYLDRNWMQHTKSSAEQTKNESNIEKQKDKKITEHRIKYKEIHGIDETGKCNISPDESRKISSLAFGRTEKAKKKRLRSSEEISIKRKLRREAAKEMKGKKIHDPILIEILKNMGIADEDGNLK